MADLAAVARKLVNLTDDIKKTYARLHRETRPMLEGTAEILAKMYPQSVPTWEGESPVVLDFADLVTGRGGGSKPVSPYDFACAFFDPASIVARFGTFKPPTEMMLVELRMIGATLAVEEGEVPPLVGQSYADAPRLLLAGAVGKKMFDYPEVAAEYERRKKLVEG